jgi:hypothetical protein
LIESYLDEPILTISKAFHSSSAVLSCNWSTGRPSVFFAHDSQGYIKYWDLTKDQYEPLGRVQIEKYDEILFLFIYLFFSSVSIILFFQQVINMKQPLHLLSNNNHPKLKFIN